jgi:hypothetical protein
MGKHGFLNQVEEQSSKYNHIDDEIQVNKSGNDVSFAVYKNNCSTPSFHIDAETGKCTLTTTWFAEDTVSINHIVCSNPSLSIYDGYNSKMFDPDTTYHNTILGFDALGQLSHGASNNIGIGYGVGSSLVTGNRNIFIGNSTGEFAPASDSIIIGNYTVPTPTIKDNQLSIGYNIVARPTSGATRGYIKLRANGSTHYDIEANDLGNVSYPYNSHVEASLADDLVLDHNGTPSPICWGYIQCDHQSEMYSAYDFVPKKDGLYLFNYNLCTDSVVWIESYFLRLDVKINGDIRFTNIVPAFGVQIISRTMSGKLAFILQCNSGDQIVFYATSYRPNGANTKLLCDQTRNFMNITKVG